MIYDIEKGAFDAELMEIVGVPGAVLPEVRDSAGLFGTTESHLFGAPIRVCGIAGDQQAAVVGQACFKPGMMKVTYGTGAFALLNVGDKPVLSNNRLLTTVAYQLGGKRTYAFEGAIFVAGAAVQWLRDGLGIIKHASETQGLAEQADPNQDVYLVPAFTGLGAPYWEPEARGVMTGLSRGAGRAELARAALESVGYQTYDLYQAMRADWPGTGNTTLRVDGGMAASDWTMQFLADVLDAKVDRPEIAETTALGAAYLAGNAAGICPAPDEFGHSWRLQKQFKPGMAEGQRKKKLAGWEDAIRRTRRLG
jgi:glycerol kinase